MKASWSETQKDFAEKMVKELREKNHSNQQIARILGVSVNSVRNVAE